MILNENSEFRTSSFTPSNWHLIAVVFSVVILITLFVSQSPLLYSTLHLLTSPLQRWKELFPLYLRLHLLALQVCAPLSSLNVRVQVQFPCLQICSFKLPVWQTGRYYCRIPDDPTLTWQIITMVKIIRLTHKFYWPSQHLCTTPRWIPHRMIFDISTTQHYRNIYLIGI